jgi:hypothetical protein
MRFLECTAISIAAFARYGLCDVDAVLDSVVTEFLYYLAEIHALEFQKAYILFPK